MAICTKCAAERGKSDKLPRGWKRIGGVPMCGDCLSNSWSFRAISLRVAQVVDMPEGETFWTRFTNAWRLSTDLANWAQMELLKRETPRLPGQEKMPKFVPFNLYGHFNKNYPSRPGWDGAAGSASALLQAVLFGWTGGKSNRNRFGVVWKGDTSAAYFRWPYPFVVRSAETKIGWRDDDGGRWPFIDVTLPGGRVRLRLAQGSDWARPLRDFDKLIDGSAMMGDTKICAKMSDGKLTGVMVRIAGRFPKVAKESAGKTATISTQPNALLKCQVDGESKEWWLHMPHLRGLVQRYEHRRQQLADDTKFEKRWPAKKRRRIVGAGASRIDNQDNRIKTAIQQVAAQVIGYCVRRGCGAVAYDDSCREFVEPFRWFDLRQRIEQKCNEANIGFFVLKGGESTQTDAA